MKQDAKISQKETQMDFQYIQHLSSLFWQLNIFKYI